MNPQTPIGWFLPNGTDRIVCPLLAINRGDTLPTRAVSLTGDLITNIDELPDDAIELINSDTAHKDIAILRWLLAEQIERIDNRLSEAEAMLHQERDRHAARINDVRSALNESIAAQNGQAAIIQQVTRERDQALAGQPRRPTKHSSPATITRDYQS